MSEPRWPPYRTVPDMIRHLTGEWGGCELVVSPGERLTYAEADRASAQLARELVALGVAKGTRVGLLAPSGPAWVVAALAVMRIGAVLVPVSTFATGPELAWFVRHADLHTLLVRPRFLRHDYLGELEEAVAGLADAATGGPLHVAALPSLRHVVAIDGGSGEGAMLPPWVSPRSDVDGSVDADMLGALEDAVDPSDPAVIMYSSGSTAEPKGAIHVQATVVRHPYQVNLRRGLRADDRVLLAMPLFWVGGFHHGLLAAYGAGACLVTDEPFDVTRAVEAIERERVTVVFSWPHQAAAIRAEPGFATRDVASLRPGSRNMVLPPGVEVDPVHRSNWLGMSETFGAHLIADMDLELPAHRYGTFGVAVPGVEHDVVDPDTGERCGPGEPGLLRVRGYPVMLGRVRATREEVFDPGGWYRTGDLGWFDEDGWFFFTGRADEVIKPGGVNVSPAEVEAVLREVDGVAAAYVVGLPDPDRGAVVAAALVPAAGRDVDPGAALATARERLSAYKVPRHVVVLQAEEVPMTATQKVRRGALADLLGRRIGATP